MSNFGAITFKIHQIFKKKLSFEMREYFLGSGRIHAGIRGEKDLENSK